MLNINNSTRGKDNNNSDRKYAGGEAATTPTDRGEEID